MQQISNPLLPVFFNGPGVVDPYASVEVGVYHFKLMKSFWWWSVPIDQKGVKIWCWPVPGDEKELKFSWWSDPIDEK